MTADQEGATRPRILLFFDYTCVFCYLDDGRFDRLARDYDVEIVRVPFELRPDIPDAGISAREHGLEHSDKVEAHIQRVAAQEGLPYSPVDHIPKTHKAMVMAEVARDEGIHPAVHKAIFRAYFGEGADIGSESVLLRIAEDEGLDTEEVVEAWSSGRYRERLHAFRHLADDLGVTATPAALICNELMIGSRPYGTIRDAVERCLLTEANIERAAEARGADASE
ncbi:MAG: DsbA family oxidoreductase [Coriobacteriia bacterium]